MAEKLKFLKTSGTKIVDASGSEVILKGVNLGGWLMMEGYMFGGRNTAEHEFRANFALSAGDAALDGLIKAWRDTFVTEADIARIKGWGANCVRLPFNYRLVEFEDRPYSLNEEGLKYIDKAVGWCEQHGVYCILDLHAAPGAQNAAWHSDSYGKIELFDVEQNRDRYLRLWFFLADRFRDCPAIAGYDILNEPDLPFEQEYKIKPLYDAAIREIRSTDKRHIIFLEGNNWAQRLECIGRPKDSNFAYSVHNYAPLDFTHHFRQGLRYPGKVDGILWSKKAFEVIAAAYAAFAKIMNAPLYLGEFGVNARDGYYGEDTWVDDVLAVCKQRRVSWTYWNYKTVANLAYPDGILRYTANPAWVNRQGPVAGWETFAGCWPKEKGSMINSWKSENFTVNEKLLSVLRKYL